MALSTDTPRTYELGEINEYPVLAATLVYEGAAVGLEAVSGRARGLVAGDTFLGFAESQADNRDDAVGGVLSVRVVDAGKVVLEISGLALTDVSSPVYASADGTFTLTPGSNSYIGKVARWESSGVGVVKFNAIGDQGLDLGS